MRAANRARRWGIYIGFSRRDSDLLGIRPPVLFRPFVSPFPRLPSLHFSASSNSLSRPSLHPFLCLFLSLSLSFYLFLSPFLPPVSVAFDSFYFLLFAHYRARQVLSSFRAVEYRRKPSHPRCRSNKSCADSRQLLGRIANYEKRGGKGRRCHRPHIRCYEDKTPKGTNLR